jgi:hypothetical protein
MDRSFRVNHVAQNTAGERKDKGTGGVDWRRPFPLGLALCQTAQISFGPK